MNRNVIETVLGAVVLLCALVFPGVLRMAARIWARKKVTPSAPISTASTG